MCVILGEQSSKWYRASHY